MFDSKPGLRAQFKGFLNTPQLWSKNGIFEYDLFEIIPTEVASEAIPKPETGVLGKRMEHFFRYYVDNYSEEDVLAHNEQIFLEKQTLGELDFILKHQRSGKITHVELVFKFYLYDPEIPGELERWIGPNRKDRLVKKLERLRQKQFPLLKHEATSDLLKRLNISAEEIAQKLCFKALLFVPFEMQQHKFSSVNPEAIQGFWLKAGQFTADRFGDAVFHSPKKPDWPILPQDNETWTDFEEIKLQVEKMHAAGRSPLVWMKTQKGEFYRFFVVSW